MMLRDEGNAHIVSVLQGQTFRLNVKEGIWGKIEIEMICYQWLYRCNRKRQNYVYGKWDNSSACQKNKALFETWNKANNTQAIIMLWNVDIYGNTYA